MASQKQIVDMIAGIKAIYSYYAKDSNIELLVKLWNGLLAEYPDEIVKVAFKKALQTCKMPPTPADIIENIESIASANEPTAEELWDKLTQTFPKVREYAHSIKYPVYGDLIGPHKRIENTFNELPDRVKRYVGSASALRDLSRYSSEELKFEKARFLKELPRIEKRQKYQQIGSAEKLKLKE